MLEEFIEDVRLSQDLSAAEVNRAVDDLLDGSVGTETKADFLTALANKGETLPELTAFARAFRDRAIPLTLPKELRDREILDVCGTGGDQLGTFNISTTVALVCSAAGAIVAKHGNRAVTSRSGSADVLAQLGIAVDLSPDRVAESLARHGFAFLYAPKFHPAFQAVGAARKLCAARGQRTLFNFLGPLLNPASPSVQLMGVSRKEWVEPLARVLQSLGVRRAMVVAGEVGDGRILDELSTLGENSVAEFYQDRGFHSSQWHPRDFPLQPVQLKDLVGGDAPENARLVFDVIDGADRGPRRDAVLLNAGAALMVAGLADSISEGWEMAGRSIDSGKARAQIESLREFR